MKHKTPDQIREDFYFRMNEQEGNPREQTEGRTRVFYRGDGTIEKKERIHGGTHYLSLHDEEGNPFLAGAIPPGTVF